MLDALGWVGAGALLLGYALVTRVPAATAGRRYLALNLAGSAGLAANGLAHDAWPSATLNLLWLALALNALRQRLTNTWGAADTRNRPG